MIMSTIKTGIAGMFAMMAAGTAQAGTLPNVNGLRDGVEFVQNTPINGRNVRVPIDCNTLSERDDRGNIITTASGSRTLAPTDRNQAFLWQFERATGHVSGPNAQRNHPSAAIFYNHLTIGHGVSGRAIRDAIQHCNSLYFKK